MTDSKEEVYDRYTVKLHLDRVAGYHPVSDTETRSKAQSLERNFYREDGELVICGSVVKAALQEAAYIVRDTVPNKDGSRGVHHFKSKVADQVFVGEEYILLGRKEPDRVAEFSVRLCCPPKCIVVRTEVCEDVDVEFTLLRRTGKNGDISEMALLSTLDYAQNLGGFGSYAKQGYGAFKVVSVVKE
jgi:hypothetical protein